MTENQITVDQTQKPYTPAEQPHLLKNQPRTRTMLLDLAIAQDDETENEEEEILINIQKNKQPLNDTDLKHILKLNPEERSNEQIEIIKNHVKDIKVFQEFNQKSSEDQLNQLCRNLYLQFLPENKVLFEQGDRGGSYFIILEGSVDISIRVVDDKTGIDYKKKVAVLKKDDAFGDLSLLYGAPRNASCHTREDSYFIVMSKDIYDKVIKSHQVEKIHEIAQYYVNFPLFQNLDKITLMYFATKTIPQKLHSKQKVVSQGDDPGRVFFVKSGRLKIIKKVKFRKIPDNGYLQFDELIEEPMLTEMRKGLFETKILQLDILDEWDVFCHHSVIQHQPVEYTVITEVPSQLYIINEIDFLTLNKKILDQFQEYIKPYPSDKELRKLHYETLRWNNYKKNLTEVIKQNKERKNGFSSCLRGSQKPMPKILDSEYLNMNDKTLVYHKNYKAYKNHHLNLAALTTRQPDIHQVIKMPLQSIQEKQFEINNESKMFSSEISPLKTDPLKQDQQTTEQQQKQDQLSQVTQNKATFRLSLAGMGSSTSVTDLKKQKFSNSQGIPSGLMTQRNLPNIQRDKEFTAAALNMFSSRKKSMPKFDIEQRKNKTIYKFENNDQQYKIVLNQKNIFTGGGLPPLSIKLIKKTQSQVRL